MHKNLLSPLWTNEENTKYEQLLKSGMRMQEIAKTLNRSEKACWHRIETLGFYNVYYARKYHVNDNFWSIPNKTNSYWAGFSMADCYIEIPSKYSYRYKLELSIKDKNHIERFIKDTNFDGTYKEFKITKKIQPHQKPTNIHTVRLAITSRQWGQDLENNFNIITKKTRVICLPDLSRPLLDCFLIGYLDGDGWIMLDKNNSFCIGVVSSSEIIIKSIAKYVSDNFLHSTIRYERPINYRKDGNSYRLGVTGVRAAVLFDYLSQIQGLPKLDRKWSRPRVLDYVNSLKLKYPHLFKTFEYNDQLNQQMAEIQNSQNLISQHSLLV